MASAPFGRRRAGLGVDGVCTMVFMGGAAELETLEITAKVAGECRRDGLPLMVEALPCPSERIPDPMDARAMASACRLGFEHGADVLKTYATGSPESFARVTASCPAPVLIAGGPRMDSERAVLQVGARYPRCRRSRRGVRAQHLAEPGAGEDGRGAAPSDPRRRHGRAGGRAPALRRRPWPRPSAGAMTR